MIEPIKLHKLLRYEPDTGRLFWLERTSDMFCVSPVQTREHKCNRWNSQYAGAQALTAINGRGYLNGPILGRNYRAHRVIWAMQTGSWPDADVDHINNDKTDNRWANLREATRAENSRNSKSAKGSSSRFLGVSWHKAAQKWRANIYLNGSDNHLGLFTHEHDAARAYDTAARAHHGEFANLNFKEEQFQ